MKPIVKTILFAVSTAIASASVFAEPNDRHEQHQPNAPMMQPHHDARPNAPMMQPHHDARPADHWRVGDRMPDEHFHQASVVDYRHYKKLPRPGRYQQWYKVHGEYVLMNTKTHHVIRVVR